MRPDFLLPLLSVSVKEITDIINCTTQTYSPELRNELRVLTDKLTFIRRRVDKEADKHIEAQLQLEGFAIKQMPKHPINEECLKEIRKAFQVNKNICFNYKKADGITKRKVSPLGIIYGEYRPYLVARDINDSKKVKNFKLDKISEVKVLEEFFDRGSFDLNEYKQCCFTCYQGEVYNVKLLFWGSAAEDASEYMFHPSQKGKWNEEHTEYLVKFKASGLKDIIWCVFRWGNECKIVSPKPVRLFYQRYMRKILRLYK
jgi:predicted DNA-binding transcriptional regulator YafY